MLSGKNLHGRTLASQLGYDFKSLVLGTESAIAMQEEQVRECPMVVEALACERYEPIWIKDLFCRARPLIGSR